MEHKPMQSGEVHPYANLFPLLPDAELAELAADIKANGQTHRIVLDQTGRLIDGRNRLRACELAGVEPLTETREFADDAAVLRFVVSANLHRRHLDESQRAMVAAGIANLKPGRPSETSSIDPVSQTQAAEMMNVSVPSLKRAKEVITHGTPELQAAVQNGEIKVSKAAAIAKKPKEEQNAEVAERKKEKAEQKGRGAKERGAKDGARPSGKKKGKPSPKQIVVPEGAPPDFPSLIRQLQRLTREAFASLTSTSSAGWSKEAQAVYLMEVAKIIEKFKA